MDFFFQICSIFRSQHASEDANNLETAANQQSAPSDENRSVMQSEANGSENNVPISSYSRSSSSNNILNANLSGSLRRFSRKPAKIHNDDDEYDSDDDDDIDHFHECNGPNQSIYAPISTSQPSIMNATDESQQPQYARNEPGGSHQRIAVAALPNLELDPSFASRPYASSPSIGSNETNRRNSHDSFNRTKAANSHDYFV